MLKSQTKSKMSFRMYRIATILKSLKVLYTLSPKRVEAFMNSYNIYNHDWANEEELKKDMGLDYYQEVKKKLVDYYGVLNHLCAVGQVEKMYIPPAMDLSKSIIKNQELFERQMSHDLNMKRGSTVFDVGCGRGRVASHMASLSGANVTGVNLDPVQLEYAKRFAEGNGLEKQCSFFNWDINDIPFEFSDEHFDAIYQIQVFTYSTDLLKLFKDLYRMLKPGGRFGCIDWVTLDAYDPKNPKHTDLMRRIKPLLGAIGTPSAKKYGDLMKKAGFKIIKNENPSIDGLQAPLIENADKFFTRATKLIHFLVACRVLPKHFRTLFDRLTQDGQSFVEADRMRLVTTCHYFVAEKPD